MSDFREGVYVRIRYNPGTLKNYKYAPVGIITGPILDLPNSPTHSKHGKVYFFTGRLPHSYYWLDDLEVISTEEALMSAMADLAV